MYIATEMESQNHMGLISGRQQEELQQESRLFPKSRAKTDGYKVAGGGDSRGAVGQAGLWAWNSAGTPEEELVGECLTTYGPFNVLSVNPSHGRAALSLRIHTLRSSLSLPLWSWMWSKKEKDDRVEEHGPRLQISLRLCSSLPVSPFVGVGKSCFHPTEMPTLVGIYRLSTL